MQEDAQPRGADGPEDPADGPPTPHDGDLGLIERVRADADDAAVEELYRRHRDAALRLARHLSDPVTAEDIVAEAFARVLQALRAGKGPTSAFRPYFLTAVRNAYVTHVRQDSRHVWTADHSEAGLDPLVPDATAQNADSQLLATAFSTLPERWQVVLWHTAVEGEDHETVGRLLGVKANAVAALSFRAREGLRKAYLAAHVAAARSEECRPYVDQLPVYLRGGLGRRRREQVEEHLESCRECSAAYLELGAINTGLGALLAPAVLGVSGVGYAAASVPGAAPTVAAVAPRVRHLVGRPAGAAVAATVLVTVMLGAAWAAQPLIGDRGGDPGSAGGPAAATSSPTPDADDPEDTSAPSTPASPSRSATASPSGGIATSPAPTGSTTPGRPPSPSSTAEQPTLTLPPWPQPTVPSDLPPLPTTAPTVVPTTPPTTGPTPDPPTTEDLSLGQGQHAYYAPHHHLEMTVEARLDPTTVTFRVAGLTGVSVHQDRDFVGTACAFTASAPGESGTVTCSLAAGSGTFAIDVWVDGPFEASARVSAEHNVDPDPSNDAVVF
ncbi:sigma-70 family RNA polymerase sigma factor [Nocardioides lijunqiniae]|uniref:sigma-70 family RNA polymerase sigma factor n=1 Tax=Nocardioides lijunqiniae TaxID=2760832 RepID=UPI001878855E|nr:sigma-70 family RNA polymerase sigma factor [Nocardioides lijunqiniae]